MLKFSGFSRLTSCLVRAQYAFNRGAVQHTHAEAKPPGNVLQMRANAAPQQIKYVECTKFARLTHNKNPVRQVHAGPGTRRWTPKETRFQGYPESTVCVQVPVGSRNSASHNVYHTSLRPSSSFEPRHPSLKIVFRKKEEVVQIGVKIFQRTRKQEQGIPRPAALEFHNEESSLTVELTKEGAR